MTDLGLLLVTFPLSGGTVINWSTARPTHRITREHELNGLFSGGLSTGFSYVVVGLTTGAVGRQDWPHWSLLYGHVTFIVTFDRNTFGSWFQLSTH